VPGRSILYSVMTAIVRPLSVIALVAQAVTLVATSSGIVATTWKFGLGWSFFRGLSEWNALLALGCFVACVPMAVTRQRCSDAMLKDVRWCIWLNIITMVMLLFVPAVAGV